MDRSWICGIAALCAALICGDALAQPGPMQAVLNDAGRSTDWLHVNHDYAGQRFVDIDLIDRENVAGLAPVCHFEIEFKKAFYAAPVVHGGVLYVTTTLETIALDAASCELRWRHVWTLKAKRGWSPNRGVALKAGLVVRGTTDGYLLALNAANGKPVWDRRIADSEAGETLTMPPLIFEDLILIAPAGSEHAIKGWVGAFRLDDGEPVWRANVVPAAGEPGAETWRNDPDRVVGGGGIWTPLSLDIETGTVFVPVGNPAPDFFGEARPGDNLYTNAVVALDVHTGERRWHYQTVPHDIHDWDLTQSSPIFSATVDGKPRDLVVSVGKEGVLRALDRDTGVLVYELPVTTQKNVDKPLTHEGVHACPGVLGGVQWNGPAYHPGLDLLVVPSVDWCGTYNKHIDANYRPGQEYMGGGFRYDPLEEAHGWLTAIDAGTGAVRWRYRSDRPMLAGVTATSAGLIFTGELTGHVLALDARDGTMLYRHDLRAPLAGGVVTYTTGGRQYLAVVSGTATGFWRVPLRPARVTVFALAAPAWRAELIADGWVEIKRKLTDFTDHTWYGSRHKLRNTEGWIYYLRPDGRTSVLRSPDGKTYIDHRREGEGGRICSRIAGLRGGREVCGNTLWHRGDLYIFTDPTGQVIHAWTWQKGNPEGFAPE